MNEVENNLARERHNLWLCGMGFRPENAEKHQKRIAELEAERDQQFKDYLKAMKLVANRLCPEGKAPPHWYRPMNKTNWIDSRRRMRDERDVPGQHH